jgi:hypothetical protein
MLSGKEMPSHRFNAAGKVIFWAGVFALGLVVVGSGLVMDQLVPGLERQGRQLPAVQVAGQGGHKLHPVRPAPNSAMR